jgi:D-serine deaminase-like pyridoxal phosphate-dependent protein
MSALQDLETPCVLIDFDRVEANLGRAQAHADRVGLALRPHIKTHKLPLFAHRQVALGACGITVQKLGEAEVMADAGLSDIFLPYNIIGARKLARLKALNERVTLKVTTDSPDAVAGYAATFAGAGRPLCVLVECDTGGNRCGVQSPAQALALARQIALSPGLAFGGLMTYPAPGGQARTRDWLLAAKDLLAAAGFPCPVISSGGTPDFFGSEGGVVTEYRPGTYIYNDRYQVAQGAADWTDCALSVLATVVSRPNATRVVIDAGSKSLSSDLLGQTGYGIVEGHPELVVKSVSEEHGVIVLEQPDDWPRIGDRLRIIPNHACVVSNLFDHVHLLRGETLLARVAVAARGRVD